MMHANSTDPGSYLAPSVAEAAIYSEITSWTEVPGRDDNISSPLLYSFPNLTAQALANGSSSKAPDQEYDPLGGHTVWQVVLIVFFTGLLSLITIIGNILVLVSFKVNRQLKTVNNYFLLSLAFADLIIGVISMNLYTTYIVMGHWAMGSWACDLWLAIDYVASNASVMNLLVISFDRYFSITRPLTYRAKRTTKRAAIMIALAWLVSLVLWAPAILFWQYFVGERTVPSDKCYIQFLTEPIITFCTAMAAFYLPVTIMSILYWRIYKETENRSRELAGLQGSGGRFGSERPHFHLHSSGGSGRSCSSFELTHPMQRRSSTLGLSGRFHCWSWRPGRGPRGRGEGEQDHSSSDSWNNNDAGISADHSGSSDEDESSVPTTRAIFSIVLNLPGMRAAVNSQVTSCEDFDEASEEDPLRIGEEEVTETDSLSQSVNNGSGRDGKSFQSFSAKMAKGQSMPAIQSSSAESEPTATVKTSTTKSPSVPISFKEAALARRFAVRARTQITKRKRMSLVKEKKAAQTLSAILFAFIVTWTPYNIMVLVNTFCQDCIPQSLWDIGYWLCYVNSTVNPMCYALCNKTFRTTFKMILMCRWDKRRREGKQPLQQKQTVRFHRRLPRDST